MKFDSINLADGGGETARASSGNVGGMIEFRSGRVDGPLLGSVAFPNTGGWDKWIQQTSKFQNVPDARADVFVVFVNPGNGGLMNLDWLQFNPR